MIITDRSFPLTVGQQIIIMQQSYALNKAISNISIAVHFEKEVDDAVMMQAITNALYRNHSALIQIRKTSDDSYEQYFSSSSPEPIEVVDMRDKKEEDLEEYLKVQAAMEFPNDTLEVPLYRIKYILKPNGLSAIYFIVCHIAFDAYFMMFLARDAFEIYTCLKEGKPFPKTFQSPIPCFEKEFEYLRSKDFLDDKKFWDDINTTEPFYTNLHGKGGIGYLPGKRCGYGSFARERIGSGAWFARVPAELVQRVDDFAKKHVVSTQSLYILVFRNMLSKANDFVEDISILSPFARRATKREKQSGGSRVSAIPLRMTFGNELSFLEAAQEISKKQLTLYKHAELPYPFISEGTTRKFNLNPGEGYASMNLTFQPYELEASEDLPFHLQYVSNGQSAMGCYLTLMSVDQSGDLMGIYEYNLTFFPKTDKLEEFHEYMLKMLDYAVDHPEATMLELMTIF